MPPALELKVKSTETSIRLTSKWRLLKDVHQNNYNIYAKNPVLTDADSMIATSVFTNPMSPA